MSLLQPDRKEFTTLTCKDLGAKLCHAAQLRDNHQRGGAVVQGRAAPQAGNQEGHQLTQQLLGHLW
jgi:hypothetical protein